MICECCNDFSITTRLRLNIKNKPFMCNRCYIKEENKNESNNKSYI